MKKLIITTLLFLNLSWCIDPVSWIDMPNDKTRHMIGSYLISDIAINKFKMDWDDAFWIITGVTLAKGILDVSMNGKMDIEDAAANYLGLGLCLLIEF